MKFSRRDFVKSASLSAFCSILPFNYGCSPRRGNCSTLYEISANLLDKWCARLLELQIKKGDKRECGALRCPACDGLLHGRTPDVIYPFLHLAKKMGDCRYRDGAIMLYNWLEANMSNADGSWRTDFENKWNGTSVFISVALAKSLLYYADILDSRDVKRIEERLFKAGNFMLERFAPDSPNINYPATAAYAFLLIGSLLDNKRFSDRGRFLGRAAMDFITSNDKLVFGEIHPTKKRSARGLYGIDLGYNVEETLPALFEYAKFAGDECVLTKVLGSMRAHLEFMLPDGAWDNSWGTRSYKWSYWGSRTSDGCAAAFAQAAEYDARFYKAALLNVKLLDECTADGLLCGGLHFASHKVPACIHHTFCHAKCLADIANMREKCVEPLDLPKLPRQENYGVKYFDDIATNLVSVGEFRATITAYDAVYKSKLPAMHPTGGAMSLLWHAKAGVIFASGTNDYIMVEPLNMQCVLDEENCPNPTLRAEIIENCAVFSNVRDLSAHMSHRTQKNGGLIVVESLLVDDRQGNPAGGAVKCRTFYEFSETFVAVKFVLSNIKSMAVIHIPIVSASSEKIVGISPFEILIERVGCKLKITSDTPWEFVPQKNRRAFNYALGMEFIPLSAKCESGGENCEVNVKIEVV